MTRNERIISLVQGGRSYTAVADYLGISRNVVAGVCFRAGIVSDPKHVIRNKSRALSVAMKASWARRREARA